VTLGVAQGRSWDGGDGANHAPIATAGQISVVAGRGNLRGEPSRDPLPDGGVLAMIGPTSRDLDCYVSGPWRGEQA
jgi:hypothetical protein